MNKITSRINRISSTASLGVFAIAVVLTLLLMPRVGRSVTTGVQTFVGDLKLEGRLSQTKVVQGKEVYLEVDISSPEIEQELSRQPTDMVLVFDTSGSMGSENKIGFAKAAMKRFLSALTPEDRVALVGFSNTAYTVSPLVSVTESEDRRLQSLIDGLRSGGGTNMSAGLLEAQQILKNSSAGRSRRLILLSDGKANQGISTPQGLSKIVDDTTRLETVLSTIGMGLGFNEQLMSKLADRGMGNYSFMETLASMDSILAKDLDEARVVYARKSELEISLGDGVQLVDASGYSIRRVAGKAYVQTGQLLSGSKKSVTLSFRIPNTGDYQLADVSVSLTREGEVQRVSLPDNSFKVAVLAPEKRDEAIASVDKEVFGRSYFRNSVAKVKSEYADAIRKGDETRAREVAAKYDQEVQILEKSSVLPSSASAPIKRSIREMRSETDRAFTGSAAEQAKNQNRLGKKAHLDAYNVGRGK